MPLPPDIDTAAPPTINDIARVAQVSLATVDRVLNARPGVRDQTVQRVNAAIAQLGYVRDTAAANLARGRIYAFRFLLPQSANAFTAMLEHQIAAQAEGFRAQRMQLSVARVPGRDPMAFARALNAVDPGTLDGVALMGPETPSIRDAIARLRGQGVSVVSLVSDLPSSERDHYVGLDNVAAGRTAAQLMGRFLGPAPGKVLVLTGSMLARDHLERRLGFDEVMGRAYPHLTALPSLEGREDPALVAKWLPQALARSPDIRGLYATATWDQGLEASLAALPTRPVVIAHELTPRARHALTRGALDAVISQDAGHLIRSAVRVMRAKRDRIAINAAQERIRIDIYLNENLPPEPADPMGGVP